MISIVLASMMAVAQPAPPVNQARQQFQRCLGTYLRSSLRQKMPAQEFDTTLPQRCAEQQAAFRRALVESDVAAGIRRATAERDADDQIEDYLARARDSYLMYLETNSMPAN